MKQQRSGFSVMRRLIVLVRPLAPFMALAVLLGVAGFVCAIFLTILGGWAILEVLGLGAPLALGGLFACAAAFALLRGVLRYGEQACNHFIAFKLLALIRDKVFTALRRLCPAKLEGRDKGDLIAVITADIELLEVFYAHTISPAAIALVMSVGMSVFIGAYHPLLGLLAAAAYLTVGAALPVLIARLGGNTGAQFRAQAGALSGYVLDSLRGLREVLQYHQGENRLAGLEERTEGLLHTEERMKGRAAWSMALTNTVILTFSLGMLAAAAGLYFAGAVRFDGVLIPLTALMSSFGPVVALANLGSTLQNTLAAGNRVLDILDEEPLVHEIAGRQTTAFSGAACEDVSFSYGEEPVLSRVSLRIPQGCVVGITGRSGSGKSTILRCIYRTNLPESGAIWYNSESFGALDLCQASERQMIYLRKYEMGYVSQFLNALPRQTAYDIVLKSALETFGADEEEKAMWETERMLRHFDIDESLWLLYPRTFSGGEKLRLNIAAAMIKQPRLLLLDEPTASLDAASKVKVRELIEQLKAQGTTMLGIFHDLEFMEGLCDHEFNMQKGEIVQ